MPTVSGGSELEVEAFGNELGNSGGSQDLLRLFDVEVRKNLRPNAFFDVGKAIMDVPGRFRDVRQRKKPVARSCWSVRKGAGTKSGCCRGAREALPDVPSRCRDVRRAAPAILGRLRDIPRATKYVPDRCADMAAEERNIWRQFADIPAGARNVRDRLPDITAGERRMDLIDPLKRSSGKMSPAIESDHWRSVAETGTWILSLPNCAVRIAPVRAITCSFVPG